MSRLLLITYNYPPRFSPGAIRPAALAKYLPALGWDVTVLTPTLPRGPRPPAPIIETGYQSVVAKWKSRFRFHPERSLHEQMNLSLPTQPNSTRLHNRIVDCLYEFVAFPDEYKGWIPFAREALSRLRREDYPDVILSTSPPSSCHVIAAAARRMFGCSWIADFRDLWAANLGATRRVTQSLHARLEKKTLAMADALVTVSAPWAGRLQQSYPDKPVHVITNGFDPSDFADPAPKLTPCFSITYTGYLYEGKRDPTPLFTVVRDLIAEGLLASNEIRIRFYGRLESWMPSLVDRYGLRSCVEINGRISHSEALLRQRESQILLLLGWSDPRETGQHTGKLFEYFGAARPILALGGTRGVLTQTLDETKAGEHVQSREELRQFLLSAYREFKKTGAVLYQPNKRAIGEYTHERMAHKFSQVLSATTPDNRNPRMCFPEAAARASCTAAPDRPPCDADPITSNAVSRTEGTAQTCAAEPK